MRVNIAKDLSTADKNLVKFGQETPEFCWRVCSQDELHAVLCDAFRFNHIRQMAPIVDADANNLVSIDESARCAGSRWALPRI